MHPYYSIDNAPLTRLYTKLFGAGLLLRKGGTVIVTSFICQVFRIAITYYNSGLNFEQRSAVLNEIFLPYY